jgi:pSer/pThr/pTyr-binding forkhead associated (FHA) protein
MSENICPSCHFKNRQDAKFCTVCGQKVKDNLFSGPHISILTNEQNSIVFPLKQGHSTIGRDIENTIVINDDRISKFHTTIICDDDSIWIKDLESKNGVYVGGKRIRERTQLRSGCLIKLGSTILKFEDNISASPAD